MFRAVFFISMLLICFASISDNALARPDTKIPDIKGCSNNQKERLRVLWRKAHDAVWKAERMITEISRMKSSAEQAKVWGLDYRDDLFSTAPLTYFGRHLGHENAKIALEALRKVERRFRGGGPDIQKIERLRCGQPIARAHDEHTDVCPKKGSGSRVPEGYHLPRGTIVTCPIFWEHQNSATLTERDKLRKGVRLIIHEAFHYVSIDNCPTRKKRCGRLIVDLHSKSAGAPKTGYYYGEDVLSLAKKSAILAVRTPDAYAYFAANVFLAEPMFIVFWKPRRTNVLWKPRRTNPGAKYTFKVGLAWEQFKAEINARKHQQTLVDVETAVLNGERRYSGLWVPGAGNSLMLTKPSWEAFVEAWEERRDRYELIDIEVFAAGDGFGYIGLFLDNPNPGEFAALYRLPWNDFHELWDNVSSNQYLADVEITGKDNSRMFYGLWRFKKQGDANGKGAFYIDKSAEQIREINNRVGDGQKLVDIEFYYKDGKEQFLGAWRTESGNKGFFTTAFGLEQMEELWKELLDASQIPVDLEIQFDYPLRFKPD